jgi:hypothetical protein
MKRTKTLGIIAIAAIIVFSMAGCAQPSDPGIPFFPTTTPAATPTISVQPANTGWDISAHDTITLTVTASVTDGGVLSYQWYKSASNSAVGGTAIGGKTNAALTLAKADYSANGDYYFYVVVTNTNDNATGDKTAVVTSAVAKVTVSGGVTPPANAATPVISVQPVNTGWDISAHDTITLTVMADVTDSGVLSYQWYSNTGSSAAGGTAISGQTSAALTLNKTAYSANGDYYFYVVVTNTNNNATEVKTADVTSAVAKVTVSGGYTPPANAVTPVISVQPANTGWNVSTDNTKTLTVTASVTDGGILSYQWYKNGSNSAVGGTALGGQTSAALTLTKTDYSTNGDYYFYVVVTNTNNNATTIKTASVTSAVATVTVSGNGGSDPGILNLEFTLIDGDTAYAVSQGTSTAAVVVIPAAYEGKPVTAIRFWGFSGYTAMTSVTIPSSVTSIGSMAFGNCTGLTSVTIPSSVTSIDMGAFLGCTGLTSVTIPASVTSISHQAFTMCSSLTSITVADGNTAFASQDGILYNKAKTIIMQMPGGKTGSFTIPDSVTSIGDSAFMSCTGLTSVTIPSSVTSIGSGPLFSGCSSLTNITVADGNTAFASHDGILYNKAKTIIIQMPGGKTGSFTIPDSVTSIGSMAFGHCTGLTSVTIPASVTSIGQQAFAVCSSLTSITIPSSVTIDMYAFNFCTSLTSVTIGSGVGIDMLAFDNCSNLTSVTFAGTIASSKFDNWAFANQGDLRDKFYATDSTNGTPGTYTTTAPVDSNSVWTKQP